MKYNHTAEQVAVYKLTAAEESWGQLRCKGAARFAGLLESYAAASST
jgi:hypothetical protein